VNLEKELEFLEKFKMWALVLIVGEGASFLIGEFVEMRGKEAGIRELIEFMRRYRASVVIVGEEEKVLIA